MWLANFENGTSVTSGTTFWTHLKERSNGLHMTGLQLSIPAFPDIMLCLSDLDRYYFVTEAIAMIGNAGTNNPKVLRNDDVAEIIGGHNLELGVGLEIRFDYTGSVKSRIYNVERYKYSPDILIPGVKRAR